MSLTKKALTGITDKELEQQQQVQELEDLVEEGNAYKILDFIKDRPDMGIDPVPYVQEIGKTDPDTALSYISRERSSLNTSELSKPFIISLAEAGYIATAVDWIRNIGLTEDKAFTVPLLQSVFKQYENLPLKSKLRFIEHLGLQDEFGPETFIGPNTPPEQALRYIDETRGDLELAVPYIEQLVKTDAVKALHWMDVLDLYDPMGMPDKGIAPFVQAAINQHPESALELIEKYDLSDVIDPLPYFQKAVPEMSVASVLETIVSLKLQDKIDPTPYLKQLALTDPRSAQYSAEQLGLGDKFDFTTIQSKTREQMQPILRQQGVTDADHKEFSYKLRPADKVVTYVRSVGRQKFAWVIEAPDAPFPIEIFRGLDLHNSGTGKTVGFIIGSYTPGESLYVDEIQSDLLQRTYMLQDPRELLKKLNEKYEALENQVGHVPPAEGEIMKVKMDRLKERAEDVRYWKHKFLPQYREYMYKVENYFSGYFVLAYNAVLNFAKEQNIPVVYINSSENLTEKWGSGDENLFKRIYDNNATEIYGAVKDEHGWWKIELPNVMDKIAMKKVSYDINHWKTYILSYFGEFITIFQRMEHRPPSNPDFQVAFDTIYDVKLAYEIPDLDQALMDTLKGVLSEKGVTLSDPNSYKQKQRHQEEEHERAVTPVEMTPRERQERVDRLLDQLAVAPPEQKSQIEERLRSLSASVGMDSIGLYIYRIGRLVERFIRIGAPVPFEEQDESLPEKSEESVIEKSVEEKPRRKFQKLPVTFSHLQEYFNFEVILKDLNEAPWERTEPHREDRQIYLCSLDKLNKITIDVYELSERATGDDEKNIEYLHDYEDELMSELGDTLTKMNREHVYVTLGDAQEGVFAGQYRDVQLPQVQQ